MKVIHTHCENFKYHITEINIMFKPFEIVSTSLFLTYKQRFYTVQPNNAVRRTCYLHILGAAGIRYAALPAGECVCVCLRVVELLPGWCSTDTFATCFLKALESKANPSPGCAASPFWSLSFLICKNGTNDAVSIIYYLSAPNSSCLPALWKWTWAL